MRACTIEDFGLIARARVEFANGLTVFSGETGSGKTMLLGALRFALGERTPADLVRRGAERARVTLEIEVDAGMRARLNADGFEFDPDEDAIVVRDLLPNGRTAGRVNGRPATGAQLRSYADSIVEIIGQHEAQRLLAPIYQLELLDRFAGEAALAGRDALAVLHVRATALERDANARASDDGRARARFEEARYAVTEIDAAQLTVDEEASLRDRRDYLSNAERIAAALDAAYGALAGSDREAGEALGTAAASLASIAAYSPRLRELAGRVDGVQSEVSEIAGALARERETTEFDPIENEQIGARLDAIERLKRKYGGSIAQILTERDVLATVVDDFEGRSEREGQLRAALVAVTAELQDTAARLGAVRSAAAVKLAEAIAVELGALAMPAARFHIALERLDAIGPHGAERAEFTLSANPGETPRSIARAASGGELSRVLLALVVVLADRRDPLALIFDEIDAGIGGATAVTVGMRLGALARGGAQVLCVTHLAQIAAWADAHYVLRKEQTGAATSIEVVPLDVSAAATEEIARMLSGSTKRVALDHAEALLRDVRTHKRKR